MNDEPPPPLPEGKAAMLIAEIALGVTIGVLGVVVLAAWAIVVAADAVRRRPPPRIN